MSFESLFSDRFRVYKRTPETDTWEPDDLAWRRCSIEPLTASGSRRESRTLEADGTHILRCRYGSALAAGRHVVLQSAEEYEVRTVRNHAAHGMRTTVAVLAEVEPEAAL